MDGESRIDPIETHRAMIALHHAAGTVTSVPPSVARIELGPALRAVAESPRDQITSAAKLNILGRLIRAHKPGFEENEEAYRALASAIASEHGLTGEKLFEVLHKPREELAQTETWQALPHEVTAFYLEDVCRVEKVMVDGIEAVWIFSEFETDAPFNQVAEWVDPHNWPARSPAVFKGMDELNQLDHINSPQGVDQWHGLFRETVQLVDRVVTDLWCDYYKLSDGFVGMTYSLADSVDGQIDIDRGFLLVNELGGSRHVKALKIVSFTNNFWDQAAQWACLQWTDFVRTAATGGSHSKASPTSAPGSVAGAIDRWASFVSSSAQAYLGIGVGWAREVASGSYRADDMVRDGARFWLQAYRDMLNASSLSYSILEQLAAEPIRAPKPAAVASPDDDQVPMRSAAVNRVGGGAQPSRAAPSGGQAGTTQPIPGIDLYGKLTTTALTRIGAPRPAIPSHLVRAEPANLPGITGVHVEADVTSAEAGLYVGEVIDQNGSQAPVQLYVSRAVETGAS